MLQLHPIVTGVSNITGVRSLMPPGGGKVGATAMSERDQGDEQNKGDFLHDAFASCGMGWTVAICQIRNISETTI